MPLKPNLPKHINESMFDSKSFRPSLHRKMFLIRDHHHSTKLTNRFRSPPPPNPKPNSPEMDPEIWSRLPEELLERLLLFVDLKSLLNLRPTSKKFESLLFSPSFVTKHSPSDSSSSSFSSFLLLSHPQCHNRFPLYDSAIGYWRNLSLPSPVSSSSSSLVSSSKTLFCFSIPSSSSLIICNFLANSSRTIESPTYPFAPELLTIVSSSRGYKIFVLCSGSASKSAYLYDSMTRSWSRFDLLHPISSDNHRQGGVLFNGSLHFTTPEPFSAVSLDLETRAWGRSRTRLPDDLIFARLVGDGGGGGRLYVVGGIGGNGIARSVKLWEMAAGEWEEAGEVPAAMCRKFGSVCYHNYEQVYCLWHRGMVCVCCYTWPEVLYYRVATGTWHWLDKCPLLPDQWSCGFGWFSFEPNLYASV